MKMTAAHGSSYLGGSFLPGPGGETQESPKNMVFNMKPPMANCSKEI
jgi:hypothetical protein